jgi:hypothetical protein
MSTSYLTKALNLIAGPPTAPRIPYGNTRVRVLDISGTEYTGDFISHDRGVNTVLLDNGKTLETRLDVFSIPVIY